MEESTGEEQKDFPVLEKVSKGSWLKNNKHRQSGEGQWCCVEINVEQEFGTFEAVGEA